MTNEPQEVFLWTNTWNQYYATFAGLCDRKIQSVQKKSTFKQLIHLIFKMKKKKNHSNF